MLAKIEIWRIWGGQVFELDPILGPAAAIGLVLAIMILILLPVLVLVQYVLECMATLPLQAWGAMKTDVSRPLARMGNNISFVQTHAAKLAPNLRRTFSPIIATAEVFWMLLRTIISVNRGSGRQALAATQSRMIHAFRFYGIHYRASKIWQILNHTFPASAIFRVYYNNFCAIPAWSFLWRTPVVIAITTLPVTAILAVSCAYPLHRLPWSFVVLMCFALLIDLLDMDNVDVFRCTQDWIVVVATLALMTLLLANNPDLRRRLYATVNDSSDSQDGCPRSMTPNVIAGTMEPPSQPRLGMDGSRSPRPSSPALSNPDELDEVIEYHILMRPYEGRNSQATRSRSPPFDPFGEALLEADSLRSAADEARDEVANSSGFEFEFKPEFGSEPAIEDATPAHAILSRIPSFCHDDFGSYDEGMEEEDTDEVFEQLAEDDLPIVSGAFPDDARISRLVRSEAGHAAAEKRREKLVCILAEVAQEDARLVSLHDVSPHEEAQLPTYIPASPLSSAPEPMQRRGPTQFQGTIEKIVNLIIDKLEEWQAAEQENLANANAKINSERQPLHNSNAQSIPDQTGADQIVVAKIVEQPVSEHPVVETSPTPAPDESERLTASPVPAREITQTVSIPILQREPATEQNSFNLGRDSDFGFFGHNFRTRTNAISKPSQPEEIIEDFDPADFEQFIAQKQVAQAPVAEQLTTAGQGDRTIETSAIPTKLPSFPQVDLLPEVNTLERTVSLMHQTISLTIAASPGITVPARLGACGHLQLPAKTLVPNSIKTPSQVMAPLIGTTPSKLEPSDSTPITRQQSSILRRGVVP